jgi:hypothetical protein
LIVAFDLAFLSVLLEKSKEVKHLVIGGDADDSLTLLIFLRYVLIISAIVFGQFVFNLLHQLNELVERDLLHFRWSFFTINLLWDTYPDGVKEILCLLRVSLKTLHDSIKVRD